MDKRENRSEGGLASSNAPTVTSWRFSHLIRDTLTHSAVRNEIDGRDAQNGKEYAQNVIYSSSRLWRDDEEAPSKSFSGRPDEKSQLKAEMEENRKSRPARCETNGEEDESNERRFRDP